MADALGYQATVDPLTGLYNLRHLTSRLENLMDEAKLNRGPLALIVCDLDNLKPINDTYGHQAGDLLLQAISREMQNWALAGYICWRTGGDEFAAALPGANAETAVAEAMRLGNAIDSLAITLPDAIVRTSVSVGLALYPGDGDNVGSLLGTADRRMYEAKADKAIEKRGSREGVAA
ncbi:MAG TPA: GGDEF domain-containing protein, partial [Dehalococcoidia bacterium]|nr:GGDEF domain-containing protein [Dehalococcoidia bacterium]